MLLCKRNLPGPGEGVAGMTALLKLVFFLQEMLSDFKVLVNYRIQFVLSTRIGGNLSNPYSSIF